MPVKTRRLNSQRAVENTTIWLKLLAQCLNTVRHSIGYAFLSLAFALTGFLGS
jgi:hypothetical protein